MKEWCVCGRTVCVCVWVTELVHCAMWGMPLASALAGGGGETESLNYRPIIFHTQIRQHTHFPPEKYTAVRLAAHVQGLDWGLGLCQSESTPWNASFLARYLNKYRMDCPEWSPWRIKPNDSSDPLTFPVAPPSGSHLSETSQHPLTFNQSKMLFSLNFCFWPNTYKRKKLLAC